MAQQTVRPLPCKWVGSSQGSMSHHMHGLQSPRGALETVTDRLRWPRQPSHTMAGHRLRRLPEHGAKACVGHSPSQHQGPEVACAWCEDTCDSSALEPREKTMAQILGSGSHIQAGGISQRNRSECSQCHGRSSVHQGAHLISL